MFKAPRSSNYFEERAVFYSRYSSRLASLARISRQTYSDVIRTARPTDHSVLPQADPFEEPQGTSERSNPVPFSPLAYRNRMCGSESGSALRELVYQMRTAALTFDLPAG
jgi:hypothetical protein